MPEWCPMRWPSGPHWNDPAALDLVRDTAINCLVLESPASATGELRPLIEQGGKLGLSFVFLTEETEASGEGVQAIPLLKRSNLPRGSSSPVVAITGNVWPSIKLTKNGGDDEADAGPTGVPWLDSNGWLVQLARKICPGKSIWIVADPPTTNRVDRPESYMRAVADAAAYGGRWVVSLDKHFTNRLAASDSRAVGGWKKITGAIGFFEHHKDWQAFEPVSVLGVLSDFAGTNEFLSTETLNLLTRRQLPFRILEKSEVSSLSFEGLKAIVCVDDELPSEELRDKLISFVRSGGLLICQPVAAPLAEGSQPSDQSHPRFEVRQMGQGRIAVAKREVDDPYVLAADAHVLLSRRNDVFRTWNAGATNVFYTASRNGESAVVQVLNFTGYPTDYMSLSVRQPYQSARLWTLDNAKPEPLRMFTGDEGSVEFHLPPIQVYAAVELNK